MKGALFAQANVSVNTILTSKVSFWFLKHIYVCPITQASYVVNTIPPPPPLTFLGEIFGCPLYYPKVPLEAGATQSFDTSYAPRECHSGH